MPLGLRSEIKRENKADWYRHWFNTMHKNNHHDYHSMSSAISMFLGMEQHNNIHTNKQCCQIWLFVANWATFDNLAKKQLEISLKPVLCGLMPKFWPFELALISVFWVFKTALM